MRGFLVLVLGLSFLFSSFNLPIEANTKTVAEAKILPAFPSAEGYGAEATGGRGGDVLIVSNLNDSGPGSLREALLATQPRTVVFNVAGVIKLDSTINLTEENSNLTIAGQTAPAPGISLRMNPSSRDAQLITLAASNVILRYMKFRRGDSSVAGDNVTILNPAHDVIIDHCSFQWGTDESLSMWTTEALPEEEAQGLQNITVQNSIISESIQQDSHWLNPDVEHTPEQINDQNYTDFIGDGADDTHPLAMLVGGKAGYDSWKKVKNIDLHNNIFAHNTHRNPRVSSRGFKMVNNLIYNWFSRAGATIGSTKMDYIGNIFLHGPMSYIDDDGDGIREPRMKFLRHDNFADYYDPEQASIFMKANIVPRVDSLRTAGADTWLAIDNLVDDGSGTRSQVLRPEERRANPLPEARFPISYEKPSVDSIFAYTQEIGATSYLNCRGSFETSIDYLDWRTIGSIRKWNRLTNDRINNATLRNRSLVGTHVISKNRIYSDSQRAGGYDRLMPGENVHACADIDNDGMFDEWEQKFGMNLVSSADPDNDGYTNIEEFINGTNPFDHYEKIDKDGDYQFSTEEFINAMIAYRRGLISGVERLFAADFRYGLYTPLLNYIDDDQNGFVTDLDFLHGVINATAHHKFDKSIFILFADALGLHDHLSIMDAIIAIDPNADGHVSVAEYHEFLVTVRKGEISFPEDTLDHYRASIGHHHSAIEAIDIDANYEISDREVAVALVNRAVEDVALIDVDDAHFNAVVNLNDRRQEIEDNFNLVDTTGSGIISSKEFWDNIISSRNTDEYSEDLALIFAEIFEIDDAKRLLGELDSLDPNQDGFMTLAEFNTAYAAAHKNSDYSYPVTALRNYGSEFGYYEAIKAINTNFDDQISDSEVIVALFDQRRGELDFANVYYQTTVNLNPNASVLGMYIELFFESRSDNDVSTRTDLLITSLKARERGIYNKDLIYNFAEALRISDSRRLIDAIEILDPDANGLISVYESWKFSNLIKKWKVSFPRNTWTEYVDHLAHDHTVFEIVDKNNNDQIEDAEVVAAIREKYSYPTISYANVSEEELDQVLFFNSKSDDLKELIRLSTNNIWKTNRTFYLKGVLDARNSGLYSYELFDLIGTGYNVSDYERVINGIESLDPDQNGIIIQEEWDTFKVSGTSFPWSTLRQYVARYARYIVQ